MLKLKSLKIKIVAIGLAIVALTSVVRAQQLEPPDFGCIQIADNGDATLNWNPPFDPGNNFIQYDIYVSNSPGAGYALLTSASPLGLSSYLQSTVLTLTNNYYYFIQTLSSDGVSNYTSNNSDTLSTIWLSATPSATGYAQLNWNSPFLSGDGLPDGLAYEVWREYPVGVWEIVQIMPFGVTNSFYEIVDVCIADMNFKVQLVMPDGCTFVSNIAGGTFENYAPPLIPQITNVSIDHVLNRSVIEWEPSPSSDTEAYIIYKCEGGNTYIVDTVWGINSTQFTDLLSGSDVLTGPVSYSIAAFDGCYHGAPPSPNTSALAPCQSSVFLPSIGYSYCNDFVSFQWTNYDGWEFGVESYVIYHAVAPLLTTPFSSLTFIPVDTVAGGDINYVHQFDEYNVYQCYYIGAIGASTDYHAFSNYTRVLTPYPEDPAYIYLGSASVLSQDSTLVQLEVEPTADIFEFTLERYDEYGLNWDEVIVIESGTGATVDLPDSQLATDVFHYTYRVITNNICGDIIDTTNVGTTILLDGLANRQRLVNTLVWSPYLGWDLGVESYKIHRRVGDQGLDEIIAEIDTNAEFYYEDDVSDLLYSEGKFCYWIEATEVTSIYGDHSSLSNIICLAQRPVIWVPNSFVVDGFNNTFSPVISFADFTSYRIIIYSRWGDIIFQSTDINAPWNGTMNGKTVQEGTYTYYFTVKDGEGRAYDYTGYVVMLVNKDR